MQKYDGSSVMAEAAKELEEIDLRINVYGSKQDNSWHEREELPPCGVPIELWFGGSFAYNCEFIVMRGNAYVMWNLDADRPDAADYMNSQFRPLRTEREKAIEEISTLVRYGLVSHEMANEFAVKMHDAGLKLVKK